MKALFIVYLLFLGLFYYINQTNNAKSYKHKPVWAQLIYYQLKVKHNHLAITSFHTAAVTGYKFKTPTRLKKVLRSLHLEHLATPSGLHLSILTSWLFPFLSKPLRIISLLPIFNLLNFYSLKRIAFYKLGQNIFPKMNRLHLFSVVMFIDFFWGSGQSSPYSFLYGFLFLGSIIATIHKSPLSSHYIPFSLLGAQCLVAFASGSSVYLIGFFFGLVLTSLFSLIFPVLVLDVLLLKLPLEFSFNLSSWLLLKWWHMALFGQKIAYYFESYQISLLVVLAIFMVLMKFNKTAGLLILLNCHSIFNAPTSHRLVEFKQRPTDLVKIVRTRWGYKTWHKQKGRCHHRHRPVGIEIKCNF